MSDLDKQTLPTDSPIIRFWQRIPVLIRAIVSGAFVESLGVGIWVLSSCRTTIALGHHCNGRCPLVILEVFQWKLVAQVHGRSQKQKFSCNKFICVYLEMGLGGHIPLSGYLPVSHCLDLPTH